MDDHMKFNIQIHFLAQQFNLIHTWNSVGNPSFYSPLITRYLPGKNLVNHSVLLGNYHW